MKTFYQILGNTVIATITNFTVWFAIIFFVYLETQSVFATSMISGIWLAATAASGFWFGSLVDHHKKKTMMLISSAISLVIYLITFGIYLSVPTETFQQVGDPLLWVFVVLLIIGVIIGNIRTIALPTIVSILFPESERDKANGMSGTATGVAFLVVSVISGLLVGLAGMYYVLLLAVVCTTLALLHLWFVHIPEHGIAHLADGPKKIDIRGTIQAIKDVPGLLPLIFFTTLNNFFGGVFMSLMDAYGLSLVSVETWGILWGVLSCAFIVGGLYISKRGLGKNPVWALMRTNLIMWAISCVFTIQPSIALLAVGMFFYLAIVPFIEASEQTIIQKVVPQDRQGRVFGFAQSVEQAASPLTAFLIGPIAQFIFIPFMTTGSGVELIGGWFGTGADRGIALVFVITGIIGITMTLLALNSKYYQQLSESYLSGKTLPQKREI